MNSARWIFLLGILVISSIAPSFQNSDKNAEGSSQFKELLSMREEQVLIHLTSPPQFRQYLVQSPRNYSAVVLFSSKNSRKCQECEYARNAFGYLAEKYLEQFQSLEVLPSNPPVLFFEMNFQDFLPIFKKLEITRLPSVLHFPKDGMLSNVQRLEGFEDVFVVRDFITGMTSRNIDLIFQDQPEETWSKTPTLVISIGVLSGGCWTWRSRLFRIVKNTKNQAYLVMALIAVLVGGHVYNMIEGPEWSGHELYSYGSEGQFQSEAYLITVIYFGLAFGMLQLIEGRRMFLLKAKGAVKQSVFGAVLASVMYLALMHATSFKLNYQSEIEE